MTLVQLHARSTSRNTDQPRRNLAAAAALTARPVVFRATDYDGDHVDGDLNVQVQDDGPTITDGG